MKKHLLKGIACGLLFAAVAGSAVYAGTGSYEEHGYNDSYMEKTFYGAAGRYQTIATDVYAKITATSTSSIYKLYKVEVHQEQCYTGQIADFNADSGVLKKNGTVEAVISRDCTDVFSHYVSTGTAYNSASEVTGIQDKYTYTIIQQD
ncbi:MAG: hypothetical protein ACI4EN_07605 [Butyrivibrio sp.]